MNQLYEHTYVYVYHKNTQMCVSMYGRKYVYIYVKIKQSSYSFPCVRFVDSCNPHVLFGERSIKKCVSMYTYQYMHIFTNG